MKREPMSPFISKRQYAIKVLDRLKHDVNWFRCSFQMGAKITGNQEKKIRLIREAEAWQAVNGLIDLLSDVVEAGGLEHGIDTPVKMYRIKK